jgi:putative SOS response-associated peptidase YedK
MARPEDPREPKRPLHFSLAGGEPFCFAGLWTRWTSPAGELVPSCTIVTCESNELAAAIHHRIPVVFADPALSEAWLDLSLHHIAARKLLSALPSEDMVVRPASPFANSARHEWPDCLAQPVAA